MDSVLAAAADVSSMWDAAEQALAGHVVMRGADVRAGGDVGSRRTPVVVCLWKRQHRLASILAMIGRQSAPCDLYLWNNDPANVPAIEAAVASDTRGPERIVVATSQVNVGGFGRFYWARELAATSPQVVFVDDDEILDETSVTTFLAEAGPGRIASAWGFRFAHRRSYWRRRPVAIGEPAKYCGTGGMVSDTTVFTDPRFFRCPSEFWFCEDIWLSYFASTALGWELVKSAAEVGWLLDDAAQHPALHRAKSRFFRLLNGKGGWIDPSAAAHRPQPG